MPQEYKYYRRVRNRSAKYPPRRQIVLTCLPEKNNRWFSGLILNCFSTSFLNCSIPNVLDVGIVTDNPVSIILTCTYMVSRNNDGVNKMTQSEAKKPIQNKHTSIWRCEHKIKGEETNGLPVFFFLKNKLRTTTTVQFMSARIKDNHRSFVIRHGRVHKHQNVFVRNADESTKLAGYWTRKW